jgi:hypothetical protein
MLLSWIQETLMEETPLPCRRKPEGTRVPDSKVSFTLFLNRDDHEWFTEEAAATRVPLYHLILNRAMGRPIWEL